MGRPRWLSEPELQGGRGDALLGLPGSVWLIFAIWFAACGLGSGPNDPGTTASATQGGAQQPTDDRCPVRVPAPPQMPNTPSEVTRLEYWLKRLGDEADRPLLSQNELAAHRAALRHAPDGTPRVVNLAHPVPQELLQRTLNERLSFLTERVSSGAYAAEGEGALKILRTPVEAFEPGLSLHVVRGPVPIRCGPYLDRLTATEGDPRFDRNNCSTARPGELLEVLGQLAGVPLVRTAYSVGFLGDKVALSAPLAEEDRALWLDGPRLRLSEPLEREGTRFEAGSTWPVLADGRLRLALPDSFADMAAPETVAVGGALTRRALLTEAFRFLGTRYGWGGEGGGRDCSRLVMDAFGRLGLQLPRASVSQSQAGVYNLEIPAEASEADRLSLLDEAQARGVVLIHFPGHIMLYLGRDEGGTPRVLHAFAEYLVPCEGGGETLREVSRVAVTDLSLGAGSSRRSFLERMTRLTVFGKPPGFSLSAFARFRHTAPPPRVPKACDDTGDVAMFRSPRVPVLGQTLRAIVASQQDTRPARLYLRDPSGQVLTPNLEEYGVGPFGRVASVDKPAAGRWTMLLADGPHVLACEHFRVLQKQPPTRTPRTAQDPAWRARYRWERDTEALYAVFVERLFSHELDDARTWPSLSALLRDPARNLLLDHLGQAEDRRLTLEPDCADLPYFLRAYYAWKTSLPFAFRRCSRGRAGVPPRCGPAVNNEMPTAGSDDVAAFEKYALRAVRPGVHSASNRTLPGDEATDMYPLPLTRRALKPGSVFNDPYGHLIVVAKWVPQGLSGEGLLLGADAQPDATVGRRRFWRGSFLFTPKTDDVGAGFKAFRPLSRDAPSEPLVPLDNAALASAREFPHLSKEQYQGSQADFYAKMDALIYPRPLAPSQRITRLVDALQEQVLRRISSVDNGEQYVRKHRGVMAMPKGYAIFETQGAWEDYATPSRDMRLLIAIDTVLGLPSRVGDAPTRFGYSKDAGETARAEVQAQLDAALAARRFAYTASDGREVSLNLRDVVARAAALEMAYNPNDCVEVRWGAPQGSDELRTCQRHAPAVQRKKMEQYRSWFHSRTRPARP